MTQDILRELIDKRLREIEAIIEDRGAASHAAANERASKIKDDVLADFIRRESSPTFILDKLASIRRLSELGALEPAYRQLEYLQSRLDYITQIVREPVLKTGFKQRQWLADRRNAGNEIRQREAVLRYAKWQTEADDIWRRHSGLSASAVAGHVKERLSLSESVGTIRRAIRKPI